MNLDRQKSPFLSVLTDDNLSVDEKHRQLIIIHQRVRKKTMELYGNYQIKKINWLNKKLQEAQNKIDADRGTVKQDRTEDR
jgi:hypothetical protein